MKWTKFSSGKFPKENRAWITNYTKVWIGSGDGGGWNLIESHLSWAEIELPEVPKRELHRCQNQLTQCCEIDGDLILDCFRCLPVKVRACPFCGYSIKEKE